MAVRIKLKGGAEVDRFSRWRHHLCYLCRAGVKKSISRGYNKRFRRAGKAELRDVDIW